MLQEKHAKDPKPPGGIRASTCRTRGSGTVITEYGVVYVYKEAHRVRARSLFRGLKTDASVAKISRRALSLAGETKPLKRTWVLEESEDYASVLLREEGASTTGASLQTFTF